MLKKLVLGLLLTSSLFAENELWKFFKYSTAYASFSLNAPRYQDDRFAIVGGLTTGDIVFEKTEMKLDPDFQKSFGLLTLSYLRRLTKTTLFCVYYHLQIHPKSYQGSTLLVIYQERLCR